MSNKSLRSVHGFVAAGLLLSGCVGPPLTVEPEELPVGTQGYYYEAQIYADDDDADFDMESGGLPPGLHLSDDSGTISGTPEDFGTFEFTIRASTNVPRRSGERDYSITIIERLAVAPNLIPGRVGFAYVAAPLLTGGTPPYVVSVIGLPAGLTFDAATGQIIGTPVASSDGLTIEVSVTDSGNPQQAAATFGTLVIKPPPVQIDTTTLPSGEVGAFYAETISASQGRAPYVFTVIAGVLPDEIRLNRDTGVISGFPSTAQTSVFTIQVVDSDSPPTVANQTFTLEINP